jgi:hypothetical protein
MLLSFAQISAYGFEIKIELRSVFFASLPDFFNDRILPHRSFHHELLGRADDW